MKTYPQTKISDLFRLVGRLIRGWLRRADIGETLTDWLRDLTERYQSKNIILNLVVRRILLVSGEDLSTYVLAAPPSDQSYVAGTLKKKAMDFLAPNALTTSHDKKWQTLRTYNEKVLNHGAHHIHQQPFLEQIQKAFAQPVANMDEIRQRMGQVMLGVIFGEGNAPEHLIDDIQSLFAEVGLRTAILGSKKKDQRNQFHNVLSELWQNKVGAAQPTLLALAYDAKQQVDSNYHTEGMFVQQIPHWMFTFTNSGSDLLGRSLALITARSDILAQVQQEIAEAGALDQAETVHNLHFLEACILETGRLYPPVIQTVHKAAKRDIFDDTEIPADTELLQFFPLSNRDISLDPLANHFQPERWLAEDDAVHHRYPNLFLSGARACPGKDLILLVNKAAIAGLLTHGSSQAKQNSLSLDPLPFSFPEQSLQFVNLIHR